MAAGLSKQVGQHNSRRGLPLAIIDPDDPFRILNPQEHIAASLKVAHPLGGDFCLPCDQEFAWGQVLFHEESII